MTWEMQWLNDYNVTACRNILYFYSAHRSLRRLKKPLTFPVNQKMISFHNTKLFLLRSTKILHRDKKKKEKERLVHSSACIHHRSSLKTEKAFSIIPKC